MELMTKRKTLFLEMIGCYLLFIVFLELTVGYSSASEDMAKSFFIFNLKIYTILPILIFLFNFFSMKFFSEKLQNKWYLIPSVNAVFHLIMRIKRLRISGFTNEFIFRWIIYSIPEVLICLILALAYTKLYLNLKSRRKYTQSI